MRVSTDAHSATMSMLVSTSSNGATGGPPVLPDPPEYVDIGTEDSTAAATATLAFPSTISAGDTIVAIIMGTPTSSDVGNMPPAPAGWTLEFTEQMRAADYVGVTAIYTKAATGSETGTQDFTGTGSFTGSMISFTGMHVAQYGVTFHDNATSGSGPILTTTAADSTIIDIPMSWGTYTVACSTGTQHDAWAGSSSLAVASREVTVGVQAAASCTWSASGNSLRCIISIEIPSGEPVATLSEAILNESPAAYFKLDGISADAREDFGSLLADASVVGTPVFDDVAGPEPVPGSYVTLGSSDAISVPSDTSIDLNGAISIVLAYKPTSLPANTSLFSKGNGDREYLWWHPSTTTAESVVYQDASSSAYSKGIVTHGFSNGVWNFMIVVLPAGAGLHEVYINSDSGPTVTDEGPTGTREANGTRAWMLGAWEVVPATYYQHGASAHFAIFDHALGATAITDIMDAATAEGWTP